MKANYVRGDFLGVICPGQFVFGSFLRSGCSSASIQGKQCCPGVVVLWVNLSGENDLSYSSVSLFLLAAI